MLQLKLQIFSKVYSNFNTTIRRIHLVFQKNCLCVTLDYGSHVKVLMRARAWVPIR